MKRDLLQPTNPKPGDGPLVREIKMLLAEPLTALGAEILDFPSQSQECLPQAPGLEFEPHKPRLKVLAGGHRMAKRTAGEMRSDFVQLLSDFILKPHAATSRVGCRVSSGGFMGEDCDGSTLRAEPLAPALD